MTTAEWRLAVAIVTIPTLPPERFPRENRHYFVSVKMQTFLSFVNVVFELECTPSRIRYLF